MNEEERLLKLSFTIASRVKRILWLEIRIAFVCSTFAQYEKITLTYFNLIDEYVMTRISQRFKWENNIKKWQATVFKTDLRPSFWENVCLNYVKLNTF